MQDASRDNKPDPGKHGDPAPRSSDDSEFRSQITYKSASPEPAKAYYYIVSLLD